MKFHGTACEVYRSYHIMLIILILTSSSLCPVYGLVHLHQKSFRSSVSSAGNSVLSSLLLGDWVFQVGNIFGVTICLCLCMVHLALHPMNRRRSGFSKNLVGTRSRPGGFRICCQHTILDNFGDFGDFVEMKSRSKHKIVAKGSRLRVAHPPPEGPGPSRSPGHLLCTGFPHRRRFSQLLRIHYSFQNIQMTRCEGFLLLQNTTCFEADLGADSENA